MRYVMPHLLVLLLLSGCVSAEKARWKALENQGQLSASERRDLLRTLEDREGVKP